MKITVREYLTEFPETRIFAGNPIYRTLDCELPEEEKTNEELLNLEIYDEQHFIWDANKSYPDNHIQLNSGTRVIILTRNQYYFIYRNPLPPEERSLMIRLFDGKRSNKLPVGYCHNKTHPGFITKPLLESHECLGKQCPFLQRFETHHYWEEHNKKVEDKKRRKKEKAEELEKFMAGKGVR